MDIHKPKPWHSFREFLKEYLIVVVGVLTALAAEAAVSSLHERRLSAEARESVRAEIDLDLSILRQYGQRRACVAARFADIEQALTAAESGRPFPTLAYLGGPGMPTVYTRRWEAATSGGRTSLLSADEQRELVRVYAQIDQVQLRKEDLLNAFARLRGLEGATHPSAETLALARQALGEARAADHLVR